MSNPLVNRVGRLHRLAVFEAAARHGSFTGAASELGITQPGVSRQVRALERALLQPLFDRHANRVVLTSFGRDLLAAVQSGFDTIDSVAGRSHQGPRRFVLAVNPGVAQRWLVPRLDSLQWAMGESEVHLWLFDRDQGLETGAFDAAIHLGRGPWTGLQSRALFPEITIPVAAPELAHRAGLSETSTPEELLDADLLHLDAEDRTWMNWADWFAHHGIELPVSIGRTRRSQPPRVSYNNYALVTQDAIAGFGVALGWRFLVDELIERRVFVAVGPAVANPGSAYQVLWPASTPTSDIDRLVSWFATTAGLDTEL